jgi:predicted phage terminase large subunit-like protein
MSNTNNDVIDLKYQLLGSLTLFIQTFYKIRTGRDFKISYPSGRESHYIVIAKALHKVLSGDTKRLIINIPPRYGKTELIIHFVAWSLAQYQQSNYIYVSYSKTLAERQTQTIRDIINLPLYKKLFDLSISRDTSAKSDFILTSGGSIYAAGAGGSITGRGAGVMGDKNFSGAVIIDDIHKPDEVTSDTIREGVIDWYYNTMQSRLNNASDTPIIFIGQRLHEHDLAAHLIDSGGWETIVLPALDDAGNALYPDLHSKDDLLEMKRLKPYVFASQYQQTPQPEGGGLFKEEWFPVFDFDPDNITASFITIDTAETDKTYNDKTVFSLWGLYKIKQANIEIDEYAIHWLNCLQLNIEPFDLEPNFWDFYRSCMSCKVKPSFVAIEKKSTGVTLISILKRAQGLNIIDLNRNTGKASRFLEIQPYVSKGLISLTKNMQHTNMCIEHMSKITSNDTHRFDDIADTAADAVKLALIDKIIINRTNDNSAKDVIIDIINNKVNRLNNLRSRFNDYRIN